MVQISDHLLAKIEQAVRDGHFPSAESLINAGVDEVLRKAHANAELERITREYDPNWQPSESDQRLIDECVGDEEWSTPEEFDAKFNTFRAKWLASRK